MALLLSLVLNNSCSLPWCSSEVILAHRLLLFSSFRLLQFDQVYACSDKGDKTSTAMTGA